MEDRRCYYLLLISIFQDVSLEGAETLFMHGPNHELGRMVLADKEAEKEHLPEEPVGKLSKLQIMSEMYELTRQGYSISEIAELFYMSARNVQRYLKEWRENYEI